MQNTLDFKYFYLVVMSAFIYSCSPSSHKQIDSLKSDIELDTGSVTNVNRSPLSTTNKPVYILGPALVFFRINNSEVAKMKRSSDMALQYELDVLFRDFDDISKSAKRILRTKPVKTLVSNDKHFYFIGIKADTLQFNREYEDMIMGQIFFNGIDSMVVEEGKMSAHEIREKIRSFYKFEDLESFVEDSLSTNQDSAGLVKIASDTIPSEF